MAITERHEIPQQPILFCEGIDFMGPFPISNGYSYILLAIDYVSRWVKAIATKTNDAKVVVDFLKSNIFYQFGVPKALISDQGSHFCNRAMSSLLHKYGVSRLLEDALRAHKTAYRTPLGMSPYQIVFGKACHLLVELKHKTYWAKVLLFKSRLKLIAGKLHSRWDEPFIITNILPYGAVELKDEHRTSPSRSMGTKLNIFMKLIGTRSKSNKGLEDGNTLPLPLSIGTFNTLPLPLSIGTST
ncbi:gag-pol, partial [Mucuna pruriens]